MTTADIIKAVGKTLKKHFNNEKIYDEQIRQGMKKPCFFVYEYNAEYSQQLGNRYENKKHFVIRRFDFEDENIYERLRQTADKMLEIIDFIEDGGISFRCINVNYRIEDNVLHFFFDVKFDTAKELPEEEKMKELEVTENVRN